MPVLRGAIATILLINCVSAGVKRVTTSSTRATPLRRLCVVVNHSPVVKDGQSNVWYTNFLLQVMTELLHAEGVEAGSRGELRSGGPEDCMGPAFAADAVLEVSATKCGAAWGGPACGKLVYDVRVYERRMRTVLWQGQANNGGGWGTPDDYLTEKRFRNMARRIVERLKSDRLI